MAQLPPRNNEAESRRAEDVAWREKVRVEDVAWREMRRDEDGAWHEKVRAEDLAWREKVRAEDMAWREKARAEDGVERQALHAQTLQCLARGLALLAAAQNAKLDTPADELARRAQDFTRWIGDVGGTVERDT
jgi:hypothetical protein